MSDFSRFGARFAPVDAGSVIAVTVALAPAMIADLQR